MALSLYLEIMLSLCNSQHHSPYDHLFSLLPLYQCFCLLTHFNLCLTVRFGPLHPLPTIILSPSPPAPCTQHSSGSFSPPIPTRDSVANPNWDRSGTLAIASRLHPDRMEMMSLKSALCGEGFRRVCVCWWGWWRACVNKPICPSKC